jgi:hypothetical protein
LAAVSSASGGVPRVINGLCENALMQALADGAASVSEQHVLQVCADLRISAVEAPSPAPATVAAPVSAPAPTPAPAAVAAVTVVADAPASPARDNHSVQKAGTDPRAVESNQRMAVAEPMFAGLDRIAGKPSLFRRFFGLAS